jgi:hypothetical protein
MARRKLGNSHTTICVKWNDKELFRKFAKFVKKTKTGELFESDAVIFHKILEFYEQHHEKSTEINSTYPTKSTSQEHDQQG